MSRRRRIFIRRRSYKGRIQFLILAMAFLALASCEPRTAAWSPAESPKQVQVDWVHFDHAVGFAGRGGEIAPAERARLDDFLVRTAPRYGDQVMVGTGATVDGPGGTVAAARVRAVSGYLRGLGLKPAALPSDAASGPWDGTIKLMVGRYIATPPACPDWTKPSDGDSANHVSSNFGCATATNLGLMVADPGDLVRGRPMGPADGEAGARAIKSYREGDKSAAPSVTPAPSQSGGGAGGGAGAGGSGGATP